MIFASEGLVKFSFYWLADCSNFENADTMRTLSLIHIYSEWDTRILTDTSGHYCELMVGAYSDNQPDYNWSFPYESKEFTHYWYGIRDMGGVKAGSRHAALNLDQMCIRDSGGTVCQRRVGPVRSLSGNVWL